PSTASPYDFDSSMRAMDPKLFAYCDAEMLPVEETSLFGRRVRLYLRPSLRAESQYSDWVGDRGLILHSTADVLRRFSGVTIQGATFPRFHLADKGGHVTATLEAADRPALSVATTYAETNGQYTIHLTIPPTEGLSNEEATIRVQFSRFFVPQELG